MNIQLILLRNATLVDAPMSKIDLNATLELILEDVAHCADARTGEVLIIKGIPFFVILPILAEDATFLHVTERPMSVAFDFGMTPDKKPEVIFVNLNPG